MAILLVHWVMDKHLLEYLLVGIPVDRILRRFLREIGLSERDAILEFNLAPLHVRRQIAALGILHRRVLGQAPAAIADLLPFARPIGHRGCLQSAASHPSHSTRAILA